jgi:uncharacterized protein
LSADEACHNVLLGVPGTLAAHTDPPPERYFAVVVDDGRVTAAAMMTPPHRLILSRTERPEALRLIAQDLYLARIMPPGVHAPVPVGGCFARIWQELTGGRHKEILRQQIYRLERVRPITGVRGSLRTAVEADGTVIIPWVRAFVAEAFGEHATPADAEHLAARPQRDPAEGLCLWDDDGPRALAGYAGPTPRGIRVGPVYTPPPFRGRGYASACVAALSQLLIDRGYAFCCLYADLANPTSNRIYQRIGYEPVCEVVEHRFLPPGGGSLSSHESPGG